MQTIKSLIALLLCFLLSAPATLAQDQQRNTPTNNTIAQDVTIIIQPDKVRFTAQKAVAELRLQVFDQTGDMIYDSETLPAAELDWQLKDAYGRAVKSGLYAYTLTLKEVGAEKARERRGHFIVDRAQDRDGSDKLWITSQNEGGVGAELTVARNENTTVAGLTTQNARTVATERGETKRDAKGRTVEPDVKGENGGARQAITSGTVNRIAKFTSATDLGNSVLTEVNGNVGIGATSPGTRLEVVHPATQIRFGSSTTDNGGYLISVLPSQAIIGGGSNWNGANWIAKATVASSTAHQNGVIQFFTGGNLSAGNPFNPTERMRIDLNGNVGIGTSTPNFKLEVNAHGTSIVGRSLSGGGVGVYGESRNFNGVRGVAHDVNHGAVVGVHENGGFGVYGQSSGPGVVGKSLGGGAGVYGESTQFNGVRGVAHNVNHGAVVGVHNGAGVAVYGTTNGTGVQGDSTSAAGVGGVFRNTAGGLALKVMGTAKVEVLEISNGSDLSENFDVNVATTREAPTKVEAGLVVSIDPASPGKLQLSAQAYDRRVAGIISGAGGIKPGMRMGQEGTLADGQHPVALSGRVYVWVDATRGAVKPGDLLTTSATPGHAMKVTNSARAQGAIIGKAMTGLKAGKGLVLVLVTLQ